jgi:hypothetical protein
MLGGVGLGPHADAGWPYHPPAEISPLTRLRAAVDALPPATELKHANDSFHVIAKLVSVIEVSTPRHLKQDSNEPLIPSLQPGTTLRQAYLFHLTDARFSLRLFPRAPSLHLEAFPSTIPTSAYQGHLVEAYIISIDFFNFSGPKIWAAIHQEWCAQCPHGRLNTLHDLSI